jgi:vanillate O-demethylase ferredoxin subunit
MDLSTGAAMLDVKIIAKHTEALDICSFELALVDGGTLPAFDAGAHIDVHLPNGLTRQYSLCNPPHEQHRYQIAVLKDADSRGGSRHIHEQFRVGDVLQISEPRNLFALAHDARRTLLFAGGIGVTPILCMAEKLASIGADFTLHYCTRSAERTAFGERLGNAAFAGQVQIHYDSGADAQKLQVAEVLAKPEQDTHLYVCGPGGFMEYILASARTQGWPEERLHREYFSAAPIDHSADGAFEVKINSTGEVLSIPADVRVIDVLLGKGFDIPMSCEQGICGTCLTRVLAGEPEHRDLFLTEEEQAINDQFTPCCSRARSAMLVLDL